MRRKTLIMVGLMLACAVAVMFALYLLLSPSPGPTYANFSRLQTGMTRDEVEAILGTPEFADFQHGVLIGLDYKTAADDRIRVYFTPDCRVRDCGWNGWEDGRSEWEKLRDRLPWIAKPPLDSFPQDVR